MDSGSSQNWDAAIPRILKSTKFQANLRIRTAITFVDGTLRAAYIFFLLKK